MLQEHKDYYLEDGLMVLTAAYLKQRGYCCGQGCRHCPYPKQLNTTTMKLEDLWIGDKLRVKSTGKIGTFEGLATKKNILLKSQGTEYLVDIDDLEPFAETEEISLDWIEEDNTKTDVRKKSKYPSEIDLHIEILAPGLINGNPTRILDHQMESFKKYLDGAYKAGLARVLIIHGKGEGILMKEIHHFLEMDSKVRLKSLINGGGATEVWLS